MTTPRDAFITALCKASLPPHYTLTVLQSSSHQSQSAGLQRGKYFLLIGISLAETCLYALWVSHMEPQSKMGLPFSLMKNKYHIPHNCSTTCLEQFLRGATITNVQMTNFSQYLVEILRESKN